MSSPTNTKLSPKYWSALLELWKHYDVFRVGSGQHIRKLPGREKYKRFETARFSTDHTYRSIALKIEGFTEYI